MSNPPLRAVGEDEAPPRRTKKSVVEAAEGGDYRELLVAMRDRLAKAVSDPKCPPRDLAALTRRLADTAGELKALDAAESEEAGGGVSTADEDWDAEAL